jgi:hypothetical protein
MGTDMDTGTMKMRTMMMRKMMYVVFVDWLLRVLVRNVRFLGMTVL